MPSSTSLPKMNAAATDRQEHLGVPLAADSSSPRTVIVGAGFAGLEIAKTLGRAGLRTTVIDRRNHHLFQPLLYQVATAALSATDVAEPIRRIVRPYRSVDVHYADVVDFDLDNRNVILADGQKVSYRYLVLAAGSQVGYFGNNHWAKWAPGLKCIDDARDIRSRLLMTFEQAERTADSDERAQQMTIAIIGGGPTGVELAGSIAELSRYTLISDFRSIDPSSTRILLIEAGARILPAFSEGASDYARKRLDRLGVTVLTETRVEEIDARKLRLSGQDIQVGLVLWAAGVAASPLAAKLGTETDMAGRIAVDPCLRVAGRVNVFALGDNALCLDDEGKPLPGLAQVAKQQGIHLGKQLASHIQRGTRIAPFVYRSRGNTAIIGRHAAVFEHGDSLIRGWVAWVAWAIIHVYLLIGFQNRLLVSVQWLWRYMTYERGARVIARMRGNGPSDEDQHAN